MCEEAGSGVICAAVVKGVAVGIAGASTNHKLATAVPAAVDATVSL